MLADSLKQLYRRTAHGIKLGLETERALLAQLGNPQAGLRCVHVAGTNGKGSVCAMMESVLRSAGCRTGLYTSPHLCRFNERIRVAGACIADDELAALFDAVDRADRAVAAQPESRQATFFEFTTAMAFEHFRRRQADVVLLETGLGGRLDATNVVTPLLSVITRIDIEHTAYLGATLEQIAVEKAGIIKPGVPVVVGNMPDEAAATVRRIARERGSPVIPAADAVTVRRLGQNLDGQKIKVQSQEADFRPLLLPLLGNYQIENVAVATTALEFLNGGAALTFDEKAYRRGLESVRWPGRCQVLSRDPVTVLDVAHNPNAARALADSLRELAGRKPVGFVVGLLADKDARGFAAGIGPLAKRCWTVSIHEERGLPAADLAAAFRSAGLSAEAAELAVALDAARQWALDQGGLVCICGSLFLAGEVYRRLGLAESLFR